MEVRAATPLQDFTLGGWLEGSWQRFLPLADVPADPTSPRNGFKDVHFRSRVAIMIIKIIDCLLTDEP